MKIWYFSVKFPRYDNLKPIGDGSYGLVASADDKLMGKFFMQKLFTVEVCFSLSNHLFM